MRGKRITELNEGLQAFRDSLMSDDMAMQRVELGIITFGPVRVAAEFQSAEMSSPPRLEANGDTPLGAAIIRGLDMLEARKRAVALGGGALTCGAAIFDQGNRVGCWVGGFAWLFRSATESRQR